MQLKPSVNVDPSKVKKSGDTMTGSLSGIAPTQDAHLVRKDYTDSLAAATVEVAKRYSLALG